MQFWNHHIHRAAEPSIEHRLCTTNLGVQGLSL